MGLLIEGKWYDNWYDTKGNNGEFLRENSQFRSWITADGSPGPSGLAGFPAEQGRYHLYVSLACPWAHRTMIFRKLKCLEETISVSIVHPHMLDQGWVFDDWKGETGDKLYGYKCLHQHYTKAKSEYSGRVTVPVLWDIQNETIVSNESSEIIRMLNSAFNEYTEVKTDYFPDDLAQKINLISKNDKNIKTTTKSRFISQNQQLIRVDDETNDKINFLMPSNIESQVKKCDALIFSDYKKGRKIISLS